MRTYYCYSCLKAMVLVVNLLVLFLGLLLTGLAAWLLVSEHMYLVGRPATLSLASWSLLAVGGAVSTLAFLGCCGALSTNRCLLGLFALLLVLLTLGEVALVVLLHLKHLDAAPLVSLAARQTVTQKYHPTHPPVTLYWDQLQQGLECCGSEGPGDWADSIYNGLHEETREIGIGSSLAVRPPWRLPQSCCRRLGDPATLAACLATQFTPATFPGTLDTAVFFDQGCSGRIVDLLNQNLNYLLFAGLGLVVIEIFGIIFSVCLCCTVHRIDSMKA